MPVPPHHPDDRRSDRPDEGQHLNGHVNGTGGSANRQHLSEISHLFLSDLRGDAAPRRRPPGTGRAAPPVFALIGARLSGEFVKHCLAYAAGLATTTPLGRIGVAIVEADELKLCHVEADGLTGDPVTPCAPDTRDLSEAMARAGRDIDRWLVVLAEPRLPHARRLLGRCDHWTLLATADHEGVVSGYRTLKSLSESVLPDDLADRAAADGAGPRVTLAMLGATSPEQARRSARKLLGVCRQFLDLPLDDEVVANASDVPPAPESWALRTLLDARWPTPAKAVAGWTAFEESLFPARPVPASTPAPNPAPEAAPAHPDPMKLPDFDSAPLLSDDAPAVAETSIPGLAKPAPSAPETPEPPAPIPMPMPVDPSPATDEVIDLPAGAGAGAVVEAALHRAAGEQAVTPLSPPMLPHAKLAVRRDGGLLLVAAVEPGLRDLSAVGRALDWLSENRQLVTMALSQFRLDGDADVAVRLYVSHADADASDLKSLLGNADVSIRTYRRLRWGDRTGVLLEAA
jgi:hypothetical protein